MLAFPDAPKMSMARCCGFAHPRAGQSYVVQARKARWWSENMVDEVLGAVVADRYGERAA